MRSTLFLVATLVALSTLARAQTPKLLKDLNTIPVPSSSWPSATSPNDWNRLRPFSRLGKNILFAATTETQGRELWISDGTPAGTKMLKDINPGARSSSPGRFRVTNDGKRAFFVANDGTKGIALWVTDGTNKGTLALKVFGQVASTRTPNEIAAVGARSVVFRAYTWATGSELFISDGTPAGTKLLVDIYPGFRDSRPEYLRTTKDGKRVFFSADSGIARGELWVTDGTSAGTKTVKLFDKLRRPGLSIPLGSSRVVFPAYDANFGYELWVSDGTAKGTTMIIDLYKGTSSGASTFGAFALGNKVVFRGYGARTGLEPYVTDGTAKGTIPLIDTYKGIASGGMGSAHLDSSGKKVYWVSLTGLYKYGIFVTDGTPAGTKRVTPAVGGIISGPLVESLGKIYFLAQNLRPGDGWGLCVSDGTVSGTKVVRRSTRNSRGLATYLTRFSGTTVLYADDDGMTGQELWKMTAGRVFTLIDINKPKVKRTLSSKPRAIARFGKYIVFYADDDKHGPETWISDGTAVGTRLLKDLSSAYYQFRMRAYAVVGDKLVFDTFTGKTGTELYVTDGTSAGTKLLKDIRPGKASSYPTQLAGIGGRVYFSCNDGVSGYEPWVTDGTASGTRRLKDIQAGSASSSPGNFAGQGDKVVFRAGSTAGGNELYITDGTSKGTRLLKDIYAGSGSSNPSYMTFNAGRVYFSAHSPASGTELWVTDFTSSGTVLQRDLTPGSYGSSPTDLSARNGKVYFQAYTGPTGSEIFVSDGSLAGTKLYLDYRPGVQGSYPGAISAIGSRKLYFAIHSTAQGRETAITDGTRAGTKVFDINPGTGDGFGFFPSYPNYRVALGSQVFIRAYQPLVGEEVFSIDNGATAEPIGTPFGSTWIQGSDPVLGNTATITGGTKLGNAVHVTLYGSLAARPARLGTAGFAHFDLKSYFGITGVTKGKRFKHSLPIPSNPSLKGVQLVFQTLSFDSNNLAGTIELSNGLHWTVGN